MRFRRQFVGLMGLALVIGVSAPASAQLASRPAEEWIKTLDGPARVAGMKIDAIVAALKLQPGQTVADIGAGSGLFEAPLAKAVGPRGGVFAVEIDAGFFPQIGQRARPPASSTQRCRQPPTRRCRRRTSTSRSSTT
jgi:predicted methyltransferase